MNILLNITFCAPQKKVIRIWIDMTKSSVLFFFKFLADIIFTPYHSGLPQAVEDMLLISSSDQSST